MASSSQPPSGYMHDRCFACASEGTTRKACKDDEDLRKMAKFFLEKLLSDEEVEGMDCSNQEFCLDCYGKIFEFYDTAQTLQRLSKHLMNMQINLSGNCARGIHKLKRYGEPLETVHKNFLEVWGNKVSGRKDEMEDSKLVMTFLEESEQDEEDSGFESASTRTETLSPPSQNERNPSTALDTENESEDQL